ncbi:MAG: hypothetical protein WA957_02490, partial [Alteraurantiacibacter sp.]
LGIIVLGWWRAHCNGLFHRGRALPCTLYFLFALAAGGYSLLVMREGVVAQLLAIPFAALLLAEFLPRARAIAAPVPRVLATLAAIGLTTPLFAGAFASPLDGKFSGANTSPKVLPMGETGECDFDRLARMPAGLVLAPLDIGPQILGKSEHRIVAASYHRNQRPMVDVLTALTGSPEQAETIVASYDVDIIAICATSADVALYRTTSPDNFANALVSGDVPGWLKRDDAASRGALHVYRVIR